MKKLFLVCLLSAAPAFAQVPNYEPHIRACVDRYPVPWTCVGEDRPCRLDFIILCARDLNRFDPRVGLNGKRGDPGTVSADVVDLQGVGTVRDVRTGGLIAIVDVINASDSPQRSPAWNNHDIGPGTWVDPFSIDPSSGSTEPPPPPPPPPGEDPIAKAVRQINEMHGWLLEIVTFVRKLQGQP